MFVAEAQGRVKQHFLLKGTWKKREVILPLSLADGGEKVQRVRPLPGRDRTAFAAAVRTRHPPGSGGALGQ